MRKRKIQIGTIFAAVVFSGCLGAHGGGYGMEPGGYYDGAGYSTGGAAAATGDGPSAARYQCTGRENIEPDYDWFFDGTGFFETCSDSENPGHLLLVGDTREATLCVFPAIDNGLGEVNVIPADMGGLVHLCASRQVDPESGETYFRYDFGQTSYNAVFAVEYSAAPRLQTCLGGDPAAVEGPNYYFCPGVTDNESYFSYGKLQ